MHGFLLPIGLVVFSGTMCKEQTARTFCMNADIAVPFWSGAQMSNAKLGMAHAATLK